MTAYAIKLALGGWAGVGIDGCFRHVDAPGRAYQAASMTAALYVGLERFGLDAEAFTVEAVQASGPKGFILGKPGYSMRELLPRLGGRGE